MQWNARWPSAGAATRGPLGAPPADDTALAAAQQRTLAGMLALSGMAAESMVRDAGWTMMDIGKRIERGLALTALLRATLTRRAQSRRRTDHHRFGAGGLRILGDLPAPQPGPGQRRRGGRPAAVRRRKSAIPCLPTGSAPGRTCGRCRARRGHRGRSGWSRTSASGCAGWTPKNSNRPTTRAAGSSSTACSVGCTVALRELSDVITRTQLSLPGRHAAALGTRPAAGAAMTDPTAAASPVLPGQSTAPSTATPTW